MENRGAHGAKNMWRWWCGGGVIAIAVVLGCASAVEFRESGREAGAKSAPKAEKPSAAKRGIAHDRSEDVPHNGGKPTMPITASFDGDMTVNINRETNLIIAVMAESDISSIRGEVVGIGGLSGRVRVPLGFTEIASGETRSIEVRVPALSGGLAVGIAGLVNGTPMSTTLELQVNPRSLSTSGLQSGAITPTRSGDMGQAPARDSTGQVVRPMKARQD